MTTPKFLSDAEIDERKMLNCGDVSCEDCDNYRGDLISHIAAQQELIEKQSAAIGLLKNFLGDVGHDGFYRGVADSAEELYAAYQKARDGK